LQQTTFLPSEYVFSFLQLYPSLRIFAKTTLLTIAAQIEPKQIFLSITQPRYADHGYEGLWPCSVLGERTAICSQRIFKEEICSLLSTSDGIWPVWFCPLMFDKKRLWSILNTEHRDTATINFTKASGVCRATLFNPPCAQVGVFATQMCGWWVFVGHPNRNPVLIEQKGDGFHRAKHVHWVDFSIWWLWTDAPGNGGKLGFQSCYCVAIACHSWWFWWSLNIETQYILQYPWTGLCISLCHYFRNLFADNTSQSFRSVGAGHSWSVQKPIEFPTKMEKLFLFWSQISQAEKLSLWEPY